MSDRRAELERKKARLQALREEKDRRRREKELKDVEEAANRVLLGTDGDRKELDEMLSSLGVAPVSDVLSSISSANSLTPEHSHNHTPDTSLLPNSSPNNISATKKRTPTLSVVAVQSTNIPPKETVLYTKQTQTTTTGHERDAHATDYYGKFMILF
jgi:dynein intermediate chain